MTSQEIARRQGIAILIDAINQQQTAYPVIELGMLRPWLRVYIMQHETLVAECSTCHSEETWKMDLDVLFAALAGSIDYGIPSLNAFMQDGICGHCKESIK